jgi:hypothetical protein
MIGAMAPATLAPRTDTHVTKADTHVTKEGSPQGPGVTPQAPSTMPRAEDDGLTRANSPEFHDRPGSGKHTADRHRVF